MPPPINSRANIFQNCSRKRNHSGRMTAGAEEWRQGWWGWDTASAHGLRNSCVMGDVTSTVSRALGAARRGEARCQSDHTTAKGNARGVRLGSPCATLHWESCHACQGCCFHHLVHAPMNHERVFGHPFSSVAARPMIFSSQSWHHQLTRRRKLVPAVSGALGLHLLVRQAGLDAG